jgi:phosphate-selective porin OprO and OprP
MSRNLLSSVLAVAVATGWALPASAQTANSSAIQQELAAMRAQMQAMAQRIDTLEDQLAAAQTKAEAATVAAAAATQTARTAQTAAAQSVTAKPDTQVTWDGAPKLATKDGWSFKPRGRLQIDTAGVDAPRGITSSEKLGIGTEFRRGYIGFDGTMPGGFGYRVEADLANSAVDLTDLYLTYKATPELTVTVGQHKPFQSMEDMTSDLFTSFMERAAFNSGFGFERRVGLSATWTGKQVLVQGGVFTDNAADLNNDANNSYSIDGRVVFMPKLGDGQLHLGASFHNRQFNDISTTARYRVRPFVHTTDLRLIDTGNFSAKGERQLGAEFAYIQGRFHATAESAWMTARRPGLADPTFNGGYAELGWMLTDDVTAYKNGVYDRMRPKKPVGGGGMGAVQINARYDWLDLSDKSVIGGRQTVMGLSALWMPTAYVRFILNYGHLRFRQAAVRVGTDRDYSADSLGMRAQFDF